MRNPPDHAAPPARLSLPLWHERYAAPPAPVSRAEMDARGWDDVDVATGRETARFNEPAEVLAVAFSPDGKLLASGSQDRTVRLWDVATGKALATLTGHTQEVNAVAFRRDGKLLASGSHDQTVRLWELPVTKKADK